MNFISLKLMENLAFTPTYKEGPWVVGANRGEISSSGTVPFFHLSFTVKGNQLSKHWFQGVKMLHKFILGLPWLQAANLRINWIMNSINIVNKIEVTDPEDFLSEVNGSVGCYIYMACEVGLDLPKQYKEFQDVFNESSDTTLLPHREGLDHAIKLIPGAKPLFGPLYNLS